MNPTPISIVQSRQHTPNHYLFRDLCSAVEESPLFELLDSGLVQDVEVKHRQNLLVFGGEELQDRKLGRIISMSANPCVWFTEDPYETDKNIKFAPKFTKILTTDQFSVEKYSGKGFYLPLGTKILEPNQETFDYKFDVVMFGSLWPNRLDILKQLVSNPITQNLRMLLITSQAKAKWVDQEIYKEVVESICKRGGEVVETFRPFDLKQLRDFTSMAKVCLNWSRSFKEDLWSVPGPRVIEVAVWGKLQLLDIESQPGVKSMFDSDSYVSYTQADISSKIHEVLNLPDGKIEEIARRAKETAINSFTWDKILLNLHRILI